MVNHKLTKIKYITSIYELKKIRVNKIPQILLIGRSNVGKSSIFNYLTNTKLARTSKTPGRTQALILFEAFLDNKLIHIIDSPGLGYAKLSTFKQSAANTLLISYLNLHKQIFCLLHIIDSNAPLSVIDCELSKSLKNLVRNYYVLITKIDRIPISKRNNIKEKLAKKLEVNINYCFCTSTKKNIGKEFILESIFSELNSN